jgi:hypothetical protein
MNADSPQPEHLFSKCPVYGYQCIATEVGHPFFFKVSLKGFVKTSSIIQTLGCRRSAALLR